MKRKQPWQEWLAQSNAEIAAAWMEAWWLDGRSHVETDRVPGQMRREIEQLHFAVMDLVANEPMRALEVAFIVARTAEHPAMVADVVVGVVEDVTAADPTLWDTVALEAAANRRLLYGIGLVWGASVPVPLRDALRRLARPEEPPGAAPPPDAVRGPEGEPPQPPAA